MLTQDSETQYQWLRNGEAITEADDVYSDLMIGCRHCQSHHGKIYNVSNSEGTVESEPIQLRIRSALDQYADAVKSKNIILPAREQSVLAKTCVPIEDIFNLALVQGKKKIKFNRESTCYTLQGFDDVSKEKLSIEYEDVFRLGTWC